MGAAGALTATAAITLTATVDDPPRQPGPSRPAELGRAGVALRLVTGTVTAGLLLLAAVVVVAAVVADNRPGPGATVVAGHVGVALLALVLQIVADRRRGPAAVLAALLVLPCAAAALWLWWWN